jgi:peptidoglycan/LPS O-acetylase OafA/YrhL
MNSSSLAMLHLLRFFLALAILIVHFPHFFYLYDEQMKPEIHELVYSSILSPIYRYGGSAVHIFWMLSGVIFYIFYH